MKKGTLLLLICAISLPIVGCRLRGSVERTPVYMKWIINGTVSEFFYGKAKGYFLEKGIDIEIKPGGPGISGPKLVAVSPGTFAVTGAEELIRAVAAKMPVKAIAVKFQKNPVCFLGRKGSHVLKPADFKGKNIAVVHGENTEMQYRALLQKAGLSRQDVEKGERSWTFDLSRFRSGELDIIPAYCFDQPLALHRQGFNEFEVIKPSDYGIDTYGDVLITGTKTIEENPDLVRSFVEAYLRSLAEATKNPDDAVQSLVRAYTSFVDARAELETWKEAALYVCGKGDYPVGKMTDNGWQRVIDLLKEYGQLDDPASLQNQGSAFMSKFRENLFWELAVQAPEMEKIVKCRSAK